MRNYIKFLLLAAVVVSASFATRAQEHFKRNLEQVSFIPKGQWLTGVSVGYEQSDQSKYQFLIIENINGDSYSFKVSPMVQYCFKDNLTAGARFSYKRMNTKIGNADLILGSDDNLNVDNFNMVTENYYGTALFRNYISMGRSMRFGFFNEIQLQLGGGHSRLLYGSGNDLTGTFERNYSINIGLTPGVVMFLNNYSAIEVNVGVLGFGYSHTKATTDKVYVAHRTTQKANFKINLFSISFGVAFYL